MPVGGLIKLSEAARNLGYHVETLRLRVRRGELLATRGAHGTYYVTQTAMAAIAPPRRSNRRALALNSLEWTWVVLEQVADDDGASHEQLSMMDEIRRVPALDARLHHVVTVKRLAGLTTAEISVLAGLTARHVRRLTRSDLNEALEEADDRVHSRKRRQARRAAQQLVADMQRRLEDAGFRYHRRPWQPSDLFTPRGRRSPAHKANRLFPEVIRHLRDGGLSQEQIEAIELVGIGQDELNELILNGLSARRLWSPTQQ